MFFFCVTHTNSILFVLCMYQSGMTTLLSQSLKKHASEKLSSIVSGPEYPALLKQLIIQGLIKIEEAEVEIQVRAEDKTIVTKMVSSKYIAVNMCFLYHHHIIICVHVLCMVTSVEFELYFSISLILLLYIISLRFLLCIATGSSGRVQEDYGCSWSHRQSQGLHQ
jgi:hypothetical protein